MIDIQDYAYQVVFYTSEEGKTVRLRDVETGSEVINRSKLLPEL